MNSHKTISFIGAGNVATHLAKAMYEAGFNIEQIFSKDINNALVLADEVDAIAVDNIRNINATADIYILAVKDDAVEDILRHIQKKDIFIVHTSGAIGIDVFEKTGFSKYGIFYPLQTFTKNVHVNFLEIPICIESNYEENWLIDIANELSNAVYLIDSEQRKKLHVAAVFACNFSNYMYHIAEDICHENNINFNILKPLIKQTAQKIILNHPKDVQTGPAARNDDKTIENHINQLEQHPTYQELYKLITENLKKLNE
ncbi:MAG: DUF2520 domain-containing protein [Flavobacteriales bacterium]|nr:DUF2520 domain-containing protein [Flavobacteriales bacterium]MCB9335019.1 DUF2520 domain-containing protein [Flavobacteriales bacterium]